jgi:hypothetical protein
MENKEPLSFVCDLPVHLVAMVVQRYGPHFITNQDKFVDINFIITVGANPLTIEYRGTVVKSLSTMGTGVFNLKSGINNVIYICNWDLQGLGKGILKNIKIIINDMMISIDKNSFIKINGILHECVVRSILHNDFNILSVTISLPSSIKLYIVLFPNIAYNLSKFNRNFICFHGQNGWSLIPGSSYDIKVVKITTILTSPGEYFECTDGKIIYIKDVNNKIIIVYESFLNWLNYSNMDMELSEYTKNKIEIKRKLYEELAIKRQTEIGFKDFEKNKTKRIPDVIDPRKSKIPREDETEKET